MKRALVAAIDLCILIYCVSIIVQLNPTWAVYTRYWLAVAQWHAQHATRRAVQYMGAPGYLREAMQVRGIFRYRKDAT